MERRVLLAISLSFLVLFLYQTFIVPVQPPQGVATNVTAPGAASGIGSAPITPGNLTVAKPVPPVAPVVGDVQARETVIETDDVRAVFTNQGGRLRSWQLKKYRNGAGEPLDLVPEHVPPPLLLPFSLRVEDAATTARLNESLYKITQSDTTLIFDLEGADGLRVRKSFGMAQDSYDILFTA